MGASKAALILMKNSHFDRTLQDYRKPVVVKRILLVKTDETTLGQSYVSAAKRILTNSLS